MNQFPNKVDKNRSIVHTSHRVGFMEGSARRRDARNTMKRSAKPEIKIIFQLPPNWFQECGPMY